MATLGRGRAADGLARAGGLNTAGALWPCLGHARQVVVLPRLPAEGAAAGIDHGSQGVTQGICQLDHQLLTKPVAGVGVTGGPATLAGVLLVGGDHGAAALLGPDLQNRTELAPWPALELKD